MTEPSPMFCDGQKKWRGRIEDLVSDPTTKAVVLVTLARDREDLRDPLLNLANKLNFDHEFPHFLLKTEIEELRK